MKFAIVLRNAHVIVMSGSYELAVYYFQHAVAEGKELITFSSGESENDDRIQFSGRVSDISAVVPVENLCCGDRDDGDEQDGAHWKWN